METVFACDDSDDNSNDDVSGVDVSTIYDFWLLITITNNYINYNVDDDDNDDDDVDYKDY